MFKIVVVLAVLAATSATPVGNPFRYNVTIGSESLGIVGGYNSEITNQPWQVSLQYNYQHFCGAFLISSRWAVTAAHCIVTGYQTNLNIRAGSSYTKSNGQTALVNSYIVHPQYNINNNDNDIALLYLQTSINAPNARAAILPQAGEGVPANVNLHISGWGATRQDGSAAAFLQAVEVPTTTWQACSNAYKGLITPNMFCAGFLGVGGRDACQGDSGGPASYNGKVVGIISWGNGCAQPNYPGVYALISSYRSWIYQNTGI